MPTKRKLTDRERAYALLAIGRRDLGWSEARYREHLREHGARDHRGRPSASTMDYAQIDAALQGMVAAGWQQTATTERSIVGRCPPARARQWKKITALWIALAEAGIVRDRREPAMLAWCDRLISEDRREWAGPGSLARCIEALKDWQARATAPTEG